MQYQNEKFSHLNWQKIIKYGVIILFSVFIVRMVYSIYIAHMIFGTASSMISTQAANMDKLHAKNQADVRDIQNKMQDGIQSMKEHADNFDDKFAKFADDFTSSLQAEYYRIDERNRRDAIYDFLNHHFKSYDADLYEIDRKKFIAANHYDVPDYVKYDELRSAVYKCNMNRHNQDEMRRYKNKVARLKAEHQEKLVKSVPKPDYWQWPLSKEQMNKIADDAFLYPFSIISLEGQCRGD